jgi:two-component system NtrC family response regulator
MSDGVQVTAEDLGLTDFSENRVPSLKDAREQVEKEMITKALRKHRGKISPAAAELGISRPTFYELLDKLGLRKAAEE